MNCTEIICRHVKLNPIRFLQRFMFNSRWDVYKLGVFLWVKELRSIRLLRRLLKSGDLEVKDYVVLSKPQQQDNRLPPPRTLIRLWISRWPILGSGKIRHYRQLYLNRPEPIVFIPWVVYTSDRIYDDFIRFETSTLVNELLDQFRFLHTVCFANPKLRGLWVWFWRKYRCPEKSRPSRVRLGLLEWTTLYFTSV
jgi:hypothetical protein